MLAPILLGTICVLILAACGWLLWRQYRKPSEMEALLQRAMDSLSHDERSKLDGLAHGSGYWPDDDSATARRMGAFTDRDFHTVDNDQRTYTD